MARKEVATYLVGHTIGGGTEIDIRYVGGGTADAILNLPAAEAMLLIDLLRNEKPIFYDSAIKHLQTSVEAVGEGDG